ncbi:hypothetical protein [Chitinophaga tropicalis]|uniref:Uncharacterized protein n=1 Tax=Chitinophaga tropicalis TaxID=2683588 RepID=A0A7K1U7F8_9BACT|nr:hypothetical protein [Chitinophaga tropicalis]MVT10281.1 hypothetical protein [Chitinophaga tropicalis]
MSRELQKLEQLKTDLFDCISDKIDILNFRLKLIQICSCIATCSVQYQDQYLIPELKKALHIISDTGNNATRQAKVSLEDVSNVITAIDMIMLLLQEEAEAPVFELL